MIDKFQAINLLVATMCAVIILFHTFVSLNSCDKTTRFIIRLPLILLMTGSSGLLLYLAQGNPSHWSFTIILLSLAVKLSVDRRRPIFTNLLHRKSHRAQ